jgi:hypothetical protein
MLTQELDRFDGVVIVTTIEAEIKKARKAKAQHSGERKGQRRRIGFCAK